MKKENINQFESFVNEIMKTFEGQGIGIIGFDQNSVLYEYYQGYRDVENNLPINRNTIFGIASITKSYTVIAILQLVEKGILDLNMPITTYIDSIKLPEGHIPTVAQLLSHAGGFYPQERFLMKDAAKALGLAETVELSKNSTLASKGIEMVVKRINEMKDFNGTPGQHHSYSNFSFGLLTELVHRYGGEKHYTDYMEKHILKPLNLTNTFFEFNRTHKEKNITKLYEKVIDHMNVTDDYEDMGFVLLGGGALKSTLNDMMTYTRLYLNDGKCNEKTLLSKDAIHSMTIPRVAYKPFEGYGYGLVSGKIGEIEYAGHSGGLTGVSSYFVFTKATQKGLVILCNTSNVPVSSIGIAGIKLLNDQKPDWQQMDIIGSEWPRNIIENTLGIYESDEGAHIEIKDDVTGIAWFSGEERLKVTIIDEHAVWVHNKILASYTPILRDAQGRATAIYSGSRIIKRKL
ncbi:serine hydrolase domain-containing protein [Fusibacter ferrireducens]|uniref:Serine hydrolase n=1 Tax=Fusibacter ferrireducens TaxID=2785058 RepID=A0ABR9ZPQ8_9FIRM|nr:serine hydrolase [Fusibacter ferrireducens]MBF4691966.1 serine hydrolase [Fusibacter ferrireducens]